MKEVKEILCERLGEPRIILFEGEELLLFKSNEIPLTTIVMTNGLADFPMNVHEKHVGEEFAELYFYLPNYWVINDLDNPTMNWVFPWLKRIKEYVQNNNTWLGHGHTMPCGKEMNSLSSTMTQNHFIISKPIAWEKHLQPLVIEGKTIFFLAVIPLFPDEMDYKQGKGTAKLFDKFRHQGVTEKLDDYRKSVLKSKWKFFGK